MNTSNNTINHQNAPLQNGVSILNNSPIILSQETTITSQAINILKYSSLQPNALKTYEWALKQNRRTQTKECLQNLINTLSTILENVKTFNQTKGTLTANDLESRSKVFTDKYETLTSTIIPKIENLVKDWTDSLNAHIAFWNREKRDITEMWKTKSEGKWIRNSTHSIEMRFNEILTYLQLQEPIQADKINFVIPPEFFNDPLISNLSVLLRKLVGIKEQLLVLNASYQVMPNREEAYLDYQKYNQEFVKISNEMEEIRKQVTGIQLTPKNGKTKVADEKVADEKVADENDSSKGIIKDSLKSVFSIKWVAVESRARETEIALNALSTRSQAESSNESAKTPYSGKVFFESRSPFRQKVTDLMVKMVELKEDIRTAVTLKSDESVKNYYKQELINMLLEKNKVMEEKDLYSSNLDNSIDEAVKFLALINQEKAEISRLVDELKKQLSPESTKPHSLFWGLRLMGAGPKEQGSN